MPRLKPQERRQKSTVEIEIAGGATILCRRKSPLTLVMCGILPLPLMRAAQRFAEDHAQSDETEMAAALAEPEQSQTLDLINRFICAVAIDPVVVLEDDGHPDHLLVDELEFDERLEIFRKVSAPAPMDTPVATPVIPELRTEEAREEFRGAEPTAPADPAPAREDVPQGTELVVDGGVVDYVGQ